MIEFFVSLAEDTGVWTPDYFLSNETECRRLMKDPKTRSLIPSLNASQLHSFKDKQLVRFRGMIQDTYNPEFYLDSYQSKNVKTGEVARRRGKFRDTLDSEVRIRRLTIHSKATRVIGSSMKYHFLDIFYREFFYSVTEIFPFAVTTKRTGR